MMRGYKWSIDVEVSVFVGTGMHGVSKTSCSGINYIN